MVEPIEKSQAWFWSPEWQSGEREADRDLELRRLRIMTADEFKNEIQDQIHDDH
jgi:hypothetical protein